MPTNTPTFPTIHEARAWFDKNGRRRFRRGCTDRCALAAMLVDVHRKTVWVGNCRTWLAGAEVSTPRWARHLISHFDRPGSAHGTGRECVRIIDALLEEGHK